MKPLAPAAALLVVLTLGLPGCGRKAAEEAPAVQAPAPAPTVPWTWHPLGGLAVVEGEVTEPTDLVLEGRSLRETRYAEIGPVRWEFFRPPDGETAVLRTASGQELARFHFVQEPPKAARALPLRPSPPPRPQAEAPRVRSQVHLPALPVPPVAARRPAPQLGSPSQPQASPPPSLHAGIPELRPEEPRTRSRAHLRAIPVPPVAERRPLPPLETPSHPQAQPAPSPRSGVPELRGEEPRARSQAHLRAVPVSPVPERKVATLPGPRWTPPVPAASPSLPWPGMGEALNLTHGPAGHKRLLLSFDGGSNAEVATEILDTLKARGVRTTIFLTGVFIHRFPALVKRMAAEGHELGNHTMNHPHFAPGMKRDPKWSRERVQQELLEADAALVRLLGRPMDPYWRAPYGEHTAEIRRWAEELGYRHVGWSEGADTLDWATPKERRLYRSGSAILQRLQSRLDRDGDGLIVLMHLGSEREEADRPSAGLGAFMDRAGKAGWTFVPVGTFLQDLGKPAWDPQRRLALLHPPPPAGAAR